MRIVFIVDGLKTDLHYRSLYTYYVHRSICSQKPINKHTNTTSLHSNYPDWKCYGCGDNICIVVKVSVAQDGKGVSKKFVVSLLITLVAV